AEVLGAAPDVVTNFFVDDVSLAGPSGCQFPTNVPWASVDVASGETNGGDSDEVTVTFDSTGLSVGTHTGLLCVNSDDTANPVVEVPLELTVLPPNGGLVCFTQNHTVAATFDGTYFKWEDNTFSDAGSLAGSNFNPYGPTNLTFFWP